jgi:hypothetical protein
VQRLSPATRVAVCVCAMIAVLASSQTALARARQPSWAAVAIRSVIGQGILPGTTVNSFSPDRPLDNGTLAMLVWGAVPSSVGRVTLSTSSAPVTIGQLDAAFVAALGLSGAARQVEVGLIAAGYQPRPDAGTEVIARALGLRYNHPAGQDQLERFDSEVAPRAEAAYTTAVVLAGVDTSYARLLAAKIATLPATSGVRHAALRRAIGFIGAPYVWGGTSETGVGQQHGGFDCSGLVWRVMALDPSAPLGVANRLGGRTTYGMARTTPARQHLTRRQVRPGDLLLFGSAGTRSSWQVIGHVGIDLGSGLMIHSSSQGVTIVQWDTGYHASGFAFGKNVLGV